jgi:hypothetical protein
VNISLSGGGCAALGGRDFGSRLSLIDLGLSYNIGASISGRAPMARSGISASCTAEYGLWRSSNSPAPPVGDFRGVLAADLARAGDFTFDIGERCPTGQPPGRRQQDGWTNLRSEATARAQLCAALSASGVSDAMNRAVKISGEDDCRNQAESGGRILDSGQPCSAPRGTSHVSSGAWPS